MARIAYEGLGFGESVRWGPDGRLHVADWTTHEVLAIGPGGRAEVVVRLDHDGFAPLCFDFLPDGRMVIVDGPGRRVLRCEPDGTLVVHASLAGVALPGLNELTVGPGGVVYVNGAGFDVMAGGDPAPGGVVAVRPDGRATLHTADLQFPNGMAVVGGDLVVADSWGTRMLALALLPGGTLGAARVWADCDGDAPDGICADADGTVWWASVPQRRCVRVAEGGAVRDVVPLDRGAFSCALGGAGGQTLAVVDREWTGWESMADGRTDGRVLTVPV